MCLDEQGIVKSVENVNSTRFRFSKLRAPKPLVHDHIDIHECIIWNPLLFQLSSGKAPQP